MSKKEKKQSFPQVIQASTAQYLTFVSSTGNDPESIEVRYEDENIWMTQKMMAEMYGVSVSAINQHLKRLSDDNEIDEAVIKQYLITASDGKNYNATHYNLQTIISIGFKIENERAVQFRKWARQIVKDYTIQGWTMDTERLKKANQFDKVFFERQLQKIREIRLSERMFYQKVTDIYAMSVDYDSSAPTTITFFKIVQNKLHYAVHRHTAAELIVERANAEKENMGLTSWADAPNGKIQKYDVSIAKNYLNSKEINFLERLVSMYLDYAEMQAERNIPMTMEDWSKRLDSFLEFNDREILMNSGKMSREQAKLHAETQFEKYRIVQDRLFESDFDREIKRVLEGEE
ncbi:virulence RhuM family protein [Patescibacteria group bacterium]|nr:virulence RhuM family protein [Patescibacteria group bacterium]MBU1721660.1 virulence RhuM family protein [Patescibacteria group bacterium]MBU1900969.1 virulence RhuM family protein [Patescibacteria group bacterium]